MIVCSSCCITGAAQDRLENSFLTTQSREAPALSRAGRWQAKAALDAAEDAVLDAKADARAGARCAPPDRPHGRRRPN
jgi:hypothetical protein